MVTVHGQLDTAVIGLVTFSVAIVAVDVVGEPARTMNGPFVDKIEIKP